MLVKAAAGLFKSYQNTGRDIGVAIGGAGWAIAPSLF